MCLPGDPGLWARFGGHLQNNGRMSTRPVNQGLNKQASSSIHVMLKNSSHMQVGCCAGL